MPSLQSIVTTSFLTGWLDLRRATSVAHSSALSTRHLGLRRDTYYVGSKQRGARPFSALVPGRRVAFAPAVKATAARLLMTDCLPQCALGLSERKQKSLCA